ncbi:hypothetical protein DFH07DRAFT_792783 [Mycena maculata]|uniref:RGS domain-containing protein n=1 Tax=Mycena maculata TaxID=230809 RepID=A0AAD7K8F0_9AGAR|nr:hypothetical protein DFH07DRAFT_792783 [Mycena maculata]
MNTHPQPRAVKVSFKSILSLPFRLCNPPSASVAKVRSCGVTPVFKVQLDDVLERKHLPPLGLKDFEEWLLYCEDAAENLYFILWLKEYTLKYKQWVARTAFEMNNAGDYRMDWPLHSSSPLAMFYARAKATFLTPNAPYELNLPSVAFAPFHASNSSPHPDPVIFTEIAIETRKMLDESLARFVTAQFSNVGNQRVLCGMIAGVVFCLLGGLTPLAFNFAHGHSRWLRLTSFPGLWFGLTVLLAALNGVCVGVYIFGDLRQLRKFELSRPAISKPQPLRIPRPRPTISYPIPGLAPILPVVQPRLAIIPPAPAHIHSPRSPSRRSASSSTHSSFDSQTSYSGETGAIHISPAYYDDDPVDGPATSPVTPDNLATFAFPTKQDYNETESGTDSFGATASFIHPFDQFPEDDYQFGGPPRTSPEDRQLLSAFDFDALPRCSFGTAPPQHARTLSRPRNLVKVEPEARPLRLSPLALIERMQAKCVPKWTTGAPARAHDPNAGAEGTQPDEKAQPQPRGSLDPSARPTLDLPQHTRTRADKSTVRKQFKMVKAVPAFAVPLTPVLSNVIVRGQWEIVVRSSFFALFICWVVLGCLLAVPPSRR